MPRLDLLPLSLQAQMRNPDGRYPDFARFNRMEGWSRPTGLVAAAQVNLNWCSIVSPIDGRVGVRRLVDPGNHERR